MEKDVRSMQKSILSLERKVDVLEDLVTRLAKPAYTNKEVLDMFGLTPQTLRQWRIKNMIGYTQVGKTILYSKEDVRQFLTKFHKGAELRSDDDD